GTLTWKLLLLQSQLQRRPNIVVRGCITIHGSSTECPVKRLRKSSRRAEFRRLANALIRLHRERNQKSKQKSQNRADPMSHSPNPHLQLQLKRRMMEFEELRHSTQTLRRLRLRSEKLRLQTVIKLLRRRSLAKI